MLVRARLFDEYVDVPALGFRCCLGALILFGATICGAYGQGLPQSGRSETNAPDNSRPANWRTLVPNTVDDQKQSFVRFPVQLIHGKHWVPALAVGAATAGLVIADQYDAGYFRRTTTFNGFNSVFSSTITATGILVTPIAFYSAGYFSKSSYTTQTAFFTAESAFDGEIADIVFKFVTDRRRPSGISTTSNFADSFVEGKNHFNGSFPSAHTITAFSVATVVSRRYGVRHKWVPLVAYGLAAAVGFSRISSSAHFPSDVFFGAAIGYSIGRFVVLRH